MTAAMLEWLDSEPCGFPRCVLKAYHEGDHLVPPAPQPIKWNYDRHCVVCGVSFAVIGADRSMRIDTCGAEACLLHWARRHPVEIGVLCRCPQREHPHELAVHESIRSEWFAHRKEPTWPWSLMMSARVEPSTERKHA